MTVATFVIYDNKQTANHRLLLRFQVINLTSFGFAFVSGMIILIWANWDFASDTWFHLKTGTLLLLIANGLTFARLSKRKFQGSYRQLWYALLAQVIFYAGTIAMTIFRFR